MKEAQLFASTMTPAKKMALVQYAQARRLEYNAYAKECSSDTGGSSSAKSLKPAPETACGGQPQCFMIFDRAGQN